MISEALRIIRVFHDLKSTECAVNLGISLSHLSELESGKKNPSAAVLQKYSEIFDIPLSSIYLMSEGLDKEPKDFKSKISKALMSILLKVEREGCA